MRKSLEIRPFQVITDYGLTVEVEREVFHHYQAFAVIDFVHPEYLGDVGLALHVLVVLQEELGELQELFVLDLFYDEQVVVGSLELGVTLASRRVEVVAIDQTLQVEVEVQAITNSDLLELPRKHYLHRVIVFVGSRIYLQLFKDRVDEVGYILYFMVLLSCFYLQHYLVVGVFDLLVILAVQCVRYQR